MPALASIPESTAAPSHPDTDRPRRSRPRSRLMVIPRRSSHSRKPIFRSAASVVLPVTDNASRQTHQPRRQHRESTHVREDCSALDNTSLGGVSGLDSPVEQTFEPSSEGSVDLDSFPPPPLINNDNEKETTSRSTGVIGHDGAADSIDSALAEAISRSVTEQLRLFSLSGQHDNRSFPRRKESDVCYPMFEAQSRSSSQHRALNHFTRELEKYADMTQPAGKVPNFTPTPTPASGATLRTVSALLPFHNEFKAAGLAITSAEQSRRRPRYVRRSASMQAPRHSSAASIRTHPTSVVQVDGATGSRMQQEPNTNTYTPSTSVDEWRYALIDEVPPSKAKRPDPNPVTKPRCIPCMGNDDQTTDGGGSQMNKTLGKPPIKAQAAVAANTSNIPPVPSREAPRPVGSAPPKMQARNSGSIQLKPRQDHQGASHRPGHYSLPETRAKATGLRRPSMTLPLRLPPDARHESIHLRKGRPKTGKIDHRPQTRAELAQLGQVLPIFPPMAHAQKQPLLQRHQSLPVRNTTQGSLNRKPAQTGRDEEPSSLPEMPCAWASGTTSSLEEAMVRAASTVAKKENEAPSRKESRATRTSKRDTAADIPKDHALAVTRASRGISTRTVKTVKPPSIPRRTSSIRDGMKSSGLQEEIQEITDRDVLRGLHVAMSAACDEEVDLLIRNKTGLHIRRFLADLMAFEDIRDKRPDEDEEQRARRRRSDMRTLKQRVRRSRELKKSA